MQYVREEERHFKSDCWYLNVCHNECSDNCIRYLEMKYLMDNSGLPKAKQKPLPLIPEHIDYDAFVKLANIKDNIIDFVNAGRCLYIASEYNGNGKTSWAIKLLLKYFDEVWAGNCFRCRGLFVHVPTLLLRLKDFDNKDGDLNELKKNLLIADIVVWDEIGSDYLSNYDLTQLLTFIDQRDLEEKSNIYTGNLLENDLANKVGAKIYSRVWNGSTRVIFKGSVDRRVDNDSEFSTGTDNQ